MSSIKETDKGRRSSLEPATVGSNYHRLEGGRGGSVTRTLRELQERATGKSGGFRGKNTDLT